MNKITHFSIKKKLLALITLITFIFLLLSGRLIWVQVVDGNSLQLKAFDQWTRDLPMRADRGDIVDCNGIILASSKTTYTLYGRPSEISDPSYIAASITDIVGIDVESLTNTLSRKGVSEITVVKNLSKEQFRKLSQININGLYVTLDAARNYPYGDFLTQVMGFTNIDGMGQSGVEQYYDKYLKGINGQSLTQTDLIGKKLDGNITTYIPSKKGATTQLTIDFYMQSFVEKAVRKVVDMYSAKSGSCIIMSAKTGEIKSMYSYPSFDLNSPPRGDNDLLLQGSRNSLVSDAYEPGSTFKILTSAIGMEENKIKSSYYCNGGSTVDGKRIRCWRSIGHGSQNFRQGIENSCNCVFMDIAQSVGVKNMYKYLAKFGIGAKTGVDISGEAKGIMLKEKNVKNVDIARIGFGQAIAVTPVQLASAVSSVINGGIFNTPHIVKEIRDSDNGNLAYEFASSGTSNIISSKNSEELKNYLYGVVDNGGGKNAKIDGYRIGGKTGTAQKYENGAIARGKYISSFLGFTDVEDDTLVCLLQVNEPKGYVYYGSIVAAPAVKEIFSDIFAYKQIQPQFGDNYQREPDVVMPNLEGLSITEAVSLLKQIGLQYELSGEAGNIVSQFPVSGAIIKKNSVVFIAT